MKKLTVLGLAAIVILSLLVFAACGGQAEKHTYQLSITANGQTLLDIAVEMEDANPTVNEVVKKAITSNDIVAEMIVLDSEDIDIITVKDIDNEFTTTHTAESITGWEFFINAEEKARAGRADDVRVSSGDSIRYVYYNEASA